MIKMPAKMAMNGRNSFKAAGGVESKRKHTTQMEAGSQAMIKEITIHLFICRNQMKTIVMTASTIT
jgi:hypothetical protein